MPRAVPAGSIDNVHRQMFPSDCARRETSLHKVHPSDNVAIIVNPDGLSRPRNLLMADAQGAHSTGPQSSSPDLQRGDPVRRYGQIIGFAGRPIAVGSWVHEDAIDYPAAALENCVWRQPLLCLSQP